MITILYDTQDERDNLIKFLHFESFCCDFSDTCGDCGQHPCRVCSDRLIDTCIQDRAEYQALKDVHNEEIIQFMHGEVFANEGK